MLAVLLHAEQKTIRGYTHIDSTVLRMLKPCHIICELSYFLLSCALFYVKKKKKKGKKYNFSRWHKERKARGAAPAAPAWREDWEGMEIMMTVSGRLSFPLQWPLSQLPPALHHQQL